MTNEKINWTKFVNNTWKAYMSVAMKMIGDIHAAEDVVQNVYMGLSQKDYPTDKLKTIGYVSVKYACINIYKNTHRKASRGTIIYNTNHITSEDFINSESTHRSFYYRMEEIIDFEVIMKHVEDILSSDNYNIITKYAEGYTYWELAEEFDVSLGTMKAKIHQIRNKLSKLSENLFLN